MIRLRHATVTGVSPVHPGLTGLVVRLDDGTFAEAIAYDELTGAVREGARVLLNTTAADLGLGTGGVHIVVSVERSDDLAPAATGREMKLRYAPHQAAVSVVEDRLRDAVDSVTSLDGMPVVVCALHSALAPVAIGARAAAPGARIVYVMTDAGALPMWFSRSVPALRDAGLLDATIASGQSVGGDLEAVTVFGALAAAKAVLRADVVVVAMGPGNLGSGSRWGSGALEAGTLVNSVAAMGGAPVVAPRISFADERARHRGVSHHTITALETIALARATVALPPLAPERSAAVRAQLANAATKHDVIEIDLGTAEEALKATRLDLRHMGRAYADDPDYFRAAAAGGVHAARTAH
jgi:hypothetical protein